MTKLIMPPNWCVQSRMGETSGTKGVPAFLPGSYGVYVHQLRSNIPSRKVEKRRKKIRVSINV